MVSNKIFLSTLLSLLLISNVNAALLLPSWSDISSEIVSGESSFGNTQYPAMASDSQYIYVAWVDEYDYNNSGANDYDVFFKFKPISEIGAGDYNWSIPTAVVSEDTVNDSNGQDAEVSIAIDSTNVYVVWSDKSDWNSSGSDLDVLFKYKPIAELTAGDYNWSIPSEVVSGESNNSVYLQGPQSIAVDSSNIYVSWLDNTDYNGESDSRWDVHFKYKPIAELGLDNNWNIPAAQISGESTDHADFGSIISDSTNIYAVWSDDSMAGATGADTDIFFKYKPIAELTAGDYNWSVESALVSTGSTGSSYGPILTQDEDNLYVIWDDDMDYNSSGTDIDIWFSYKPKSEVGTNNAWSNSPEIVSTESTTDGSNWYYNKDINVANNFIHVVWSDDDDQNACGATSNVKFKAKKISELGKDNSWIPSGVGSDKNTTVVTTETGGSFPQIEVTSDYMFLLWDDYGVAADFNGSLTDQDIYFKHLPLVSPSLEITNPPNGSSISSDNLTMSYTPTLGTSSIANYWLKSGTGSWINNSTSTSYLFNFSGTGNYTLYVKATDETDRNSAAQSISVTMEAGGGVAVCGNSACELGETPANCPEDCPAICGDLACTHTETPETCPEDCFALEGDVTLDGVVDETDLECIINDLHSKHLFAPVDYPEVKASDFPGGIDGIYKGEGFLAVLYRDKHNMKVWDYYSGQWEYSPVFYYGVDEVIVGENYLAVAFRNNYQLAVWKLSTQTWSYSPIFNFGIEDIVSCGPYLGVLYKNGYQIKTWALPLNDWEPSSIFNYGAKKYLCSGNEWYVFYDYRPYPGENETSKLKTSPAPEPAWSMGRIVNYSENVCHLGGCCSPDNCISGVCYINSAQDCPAMQAADLDSDSDVDSQDFVSIENDLLKENIDIRCGNNNCSSEESAESCPSDCPPVCGDLACTHTETPETCPEDCYCEGDAECKSDEVCVEGKCRKKGDGNSDGKTDKKDYTCALLLLTGQNEAFEENCESEDSFDFDDDSDVDEDDFKELEVLLEEKGEPYKCGDNICDPEESCETCYPDCYELCIPSFTITIEEPCCGDGKCAYNENSVMCAIDCPPSCGDLVCNLSETPSSCSTDCEAECRDSICSLGETAHNCPSDCPPVCGDSLCTGKEANLDCLEDCPPSQPCGDKVCSETETTTSCPSDCPPVCGDLVCSINETPDTCEKDCKSTCGDGVCEALESKITCPSDCSSDCGDGYCISPETAETCPDDCKDTCGDLVCGDTENPANCIKDCSSRCGDGYCLSPETENTCPEDCKNPPFKSKVIDQIVRKLKITRDITYSSEELSDAETKHTYGVKITVKNIGFNFTYKNLSLTEIIPEEFATKTDNVSLETPGLNFTNETPLTLNYAIASLAPEAEETIEYTIYKTTSEGENPPEAIYFDAPLVIPAVFPGTVSPSSCQNSCDDSNPCTVDLCIGSKCTHVPEKEGIACGFGKECVAEECLLVSSARMGGQGIVEEIIYLISTLIKAIAGDVIETAPFLFLLLIVLALIAAHCAYNYLRGLFLPQLTSSRQKKQVTAVLLALAILEFVLPFGVNRALGVEIAIAFAILEISSSLLIYYYKKRKSAPEAVKV